MRVKSWMQRTLGVMLGGLWLAVFPGFAPSAHALVMDFGADATSTGVTYPAFYDGITGEGGTNDNLGGVGGTLTLTFDTSSVPDTATLTGIQLFVSFTATEGKDAFSVSLFDGSTNTSLGSFGGGGTTKFSSIIPMSGSTFGDSGTTTDTNAQNVLISLGGVASAAYQNEITASNHLIVVITQTADNGNSNDYLQGANLELNLSVPAATNAEPGTLLLVGTGLVIAGTYGRRRLLGAAPIRP